MLERFQKLLLHLWKVAAATIDNPQKEHTKKQQTNKQNVRAHLIQPSCYISFYRSPSDSHLLLDFLPLLSSGPFCLLLQCHKLGKGKEGEVESLETIGCKSLSISCRQMVMMMVLLCDQLWSVVWSVVWSVSDWWQSGDDDVDGCVIRLSSIPCSGWYEGQPRTCKLHFCPHLYNTFYHLQEQFQRLWVDFARFTCV